MFLLRSIEFALEQPKHLLYSMAGLPRRVERVVIDDRRETVAMPDFGCRPAEPQGGYAAGSEDVPILCSLAKCQAGGVSPRHVQRHDSDARWDWYDG